MSLGSKIKAARKEAGLTQETLAKRIGVDKSHIYKLEAGKTLGSMRVIVNIANALDVSLSDLVDN